MASNTNKSIRNLFELRALPHAAAALVACGAGSALAQGNPEAGRLLYEERLVSVQGSLTSCRECHGAVLDYRMIRFNNASEATILSQFNGAIASNRAGMGAFSIWTTQQRTDVAAYINRGMPPTPPPAGTPPAPAITPLSMTFAGTTTVNSRSATQNLMMNNASASAITMATNAITLISGTAGEFWVVQNTAGVAQCPGGGGSLSANTTCAYGIQFEPKGSGTRAAVWAANFGNNVPSRLFTLSGTGTGGSPAPAPTPTPTPTPSPAPSPSPGAAADDGGGGAFAWFGLFGLLGALMVRTPRRRGR